MYNVNCNIHIRQNINIKNIISNNVFAYKHPYDRESLLKIIKLYFSYPTLRKEE